MTASVSRFTAVCSRSLAWLLLAPIRLYMRFVSPLLPARCRYHPTCSAYAAEAIRQLGPAKGLVVAAWRLARCNPWSNGGYDPLCERRLFRVPATGGPVDRPSRGAAA